MLNETRNEAEGAVMTEMKQNVISRSYIYLIIDTEGRQEQSRGHKI